MEKPLNLYFNLLYIAKYLFLNSLPATTTVHLYNSALYSLLQELR